MGYKINRDTQAIVCRIVATGGTLEHAADAIGCTERALYAARDRDPEFDKQVRECQSRSRHESLASLAEAAKEDGNLAYKRLRILYPDDYARAANTVQVKSVSMLLNEIYFTIKDVVKDPLVMEKICRCLLQAMNGVREQGLPNRSDSQQDTHEVGFGEDDRDVEGELAALAQCDNATTEEAA